MYHIVLEVRFSIYITVPSVCHGVVRLVSSNSYIISTAVRSGLPDGLLVCHGVVRLV